MAATVIDCILILQELLTGMLIALELLDILNV